MGDGGLTLKQKTTVWIGFDPDQMPAFAVARHSAERNCTLHIRPQGVNLQDLRERGLYTRPTSLVNNRLFDHISGAPMSTEFAISRFLVPILAGSGLALFMDCDVLVLGNISKLLVSHADTNKAVHVVKHDFKPTETVKMDGQLQTVYDRKNWSSVMLFNCDHPANKKLTPELVNTVPGRDLHRFCWLKDSEIGSLDPSWNYLVGHTKNVTKPDIVHFTDGYPLLPGYENVEYADHWRGMMRSWVAIG